MKDINKYEKLNQQNAIHKVLASKATVLALARQGIFYIPAIIILPRLFAQTGIAVAQPVADILSFILTIFLVMPTLKKLKAKTKSNI